MAFRKQFVHVLVVCISGILTATCAPVRVVVNTESGAVAGQINGTLYGSGSPGRPNVASFLGIPYAQPPIGIRRFRPPEVGMKWMGVREATAPGPICAQLPLISAVHVPEKLRPSVTEDCLYLNIWAPADSNGSFVHKKRPVLIFLHGGAFMTGSGYQMMGEPFYNAQGLADDAGSVFVTVNYRLGVFGYLADPELKAESGTTGNYGLQDQRAAMTWTQRNAVAFGGDPARITLIGESAGATSALHHAVLPRSSGLFAQVISESGYDKTWPLHEAYSAGERIATHLSCHDFSSRASCLRNASAKELLEAQDEVFFRGDYISRILFFGPVSDGFELPENMSFVDAVKAAKPSFPVILGSNLNESNLFLCFDHSLSKMSWEDAAKYLRVRVGQVVPGSNVTEGVMQQILKLYNRFATPRDALMAAATDFLFTCSMRRTAKVFAASGAPVYRYLFSRPPAMFKIDHCLGVPHAAELNLLFRDAFPKQAQTVVVGDIAEQKIADFMIGAWSQFAHGHSPAVNWHRWNASHPTLQLGDPEHGNISHLFGYRDTECSEMDLLMNARDPQVSQRSMEDDVLVI